MSENDITLHDALKSSYNDKKARQKLSNAGYKYDSMLSNHNQQVWHNPNTNKLLYNVAGTHNLKDVGTDIYLALGGLKKTNRYKEADRKLEEAKKKYNVSNATVTAHSLGASIASGISKKDDKVYALDAGYTIGQKTRDRDGNHHHYRSQGDLVSALGANATNMTTLKQNNLGVLNYLNPLASHDINNIKKENIII
jgi:hypothetical protein